MKTITQAKPLEFQVADVCPHCGQVMPVAVASKPPAEVIIRGAKQDVIHVSKIGGYSKGRRRYMRQVPVVEVTARDE